MSKQELTRSRSTHYLNITRILTKQTEKLVQVIYNSKITRTKYTGYGDLPALLPQIKWQKTHHVVLIHLVHHEELVPVFKFEYTVIFFNIEI